MDALANYWLSLVVIGAAITVIVRLVWGSRGIAAHADAGEGGSAMGNAILIMLALAGAVAIAYDIISAGKLGAAILGLVLTFITGG